MHVEAPRHICIGLLDRRGRHGGSRWHIREIGHDHRIL